MYFLASVLYIFIHFTVGCSLTTGTNEAIHINPCASPVNHSRPWDHGIIPYRISSEVPDSLRAPLHVAMRAVENTSCVRFLPRTDEADYIYIKYGDRCCSHNGVVGTGPHFLYVSEICINKNESLTETIKKLTDLISHKHCENICGNSFIMVPGSSPGFVRSPGVPQYTSNAHCVWRFWIQPHRKTLLLSFINGIKLEKVDNECSVDYIQIIQEDSKNRLLNKSRLCGTHSPLQINASNATSVVSVHFRSDSSTEYEGFVMHYSLANDTVLCSVQNGGCSQLCLSNSKGEKIGCSCRLGYNLSSDGASCDDINECLMNRSLCEHKCQNTEGSYYCDCRQGYGLSNDLRSCQECGGDYKAISGSISSPGYPNPYPPHQNCRWRIPKRNGHYLNITITNVSILKSQNCSDDFLRASHGHFPNKKLCGQYSTIQYILKSRVVFRFHSGPAISGGSHSGFSLSYRHVPSSEITQLELNSVYVNGKKIDYDTRPWFQ